MFNQGDDQREKVEPLTAALNKYTTEIRIYEKQADEWEAKGKKIIRRYKDDRSPREGERNRFNILWSNIQTLAPSVYGSIPKPNIERRFRDQDDVGRFASDILERCVTYFLKEKPFNNAMKQAVFDYLLPGRGTGWVRYVPHFRDIEMPGDMGPEVTDDPVTGESIGAAPAQEVYYEEVCVDYVHWQDFGHNVGRTWDEIYLVWRKVYLTRPELVKRFGKQIGNKIPLDYAPKDIKNSKIDGSLNKATIYEAWDKKEKKAIWLHKDYPELLDSLEDPLELKDFFPCPTPMLANLANDTCIPTADYTQYQDQALELDQLTARIASIQKSLKVAGVYDTSAKGVERLLSEGVENTLIPVDQWAVFAEKGGLKGVMDLLPLTDIANTIKILYSVRAQVKADLYEIAGISDMQRGVSDPDETATAQTLKGQYSSVRLEDKQKAVHEFARDFVVLIAEVVAKHFSIDTIKKISGVTLMTNQEKQQAQALLQPPAPPPGMGPHPGVPGQPPAPGMPMGAPQLPAAKLEQIQEMLSDPSWEDVEALLKDDAALCFRIDIETDSTVKVDQELEKAARMEFVKVATAGIAQMVTIQDPRLLALAAKMLMFAIRAFKTGRELESALENTVRQFENDAQTQQGQQKPDPKMAEIAANSQAKQAEMNLEAKLESQRITMQAQADARSDQNEAAQDAARTRAEMARDAAAAQNEMKMKAFEAMIDAKMGAMQAAQERTTQIIIAHINAASRIESSRVTSGTDDGLQPFQFEQSREGA